MTITLKYVGTKNIDCQTSVVYQRGEEMRKLKMKKEKSCVLDVGFGLIRKGNGSREVLINWEMKDSRG